MSCAPTTAPATGSLRKLTGEHRTRRWHLLVGRAIWLALAGFSLTLLAASLPVTLHQLRTPCTGLACSPPQPTLEQAHVLRADLSLSLDAYAFCVLAIQLASVLIWIGVGMSLWKRFDRVVVLLLALQGICQGVLSPNAFAENGLVDVLARARVPWLFPAVGLETLNQVLLFFVLALFPTGCFAPRWTRWVGVLWVAVEAGFLVARSSPAPASRVPTFNALFLPIILLGLIAQTYRYRRVSTFAERQQTKWIVVGFVASNALEIGLVAAQAIAGPLRQPGSLYVPAPYLILVLAFSVLTAASYIIAVLRYHLWDIDVIIRRSLIYGTLSAILVALYFGVVVGLQLFVTALTHQANPQPVVIVVTTLLIAALFNPLRHGIQATIDRRFCQAKYDAARTLEAFAATLRSETDLAELSARLVAVVHETKRSARASLWLIRMARPQDSIASPHRTGPPAPGPRVEESTLAEAAAGVAAAGGRL
jgi:hypothetical protein